MNRPRPIACEWRMCVARFRPRYPHQRFCCEQHRRAAARERQHDRARWEARADG